MCDEKNCEHYRKDGCLTGCSPAVSVSNFRLIDGLNNLTDKWEKRAKDRNKKFKETDNLTFAIEQATLEHCLAQVKAIILGI